MIYEIYLDEKILYYPNDSKYVAFNAELSQALNDSGTLVLDIPKTNPLYDSVKSRKSMLTVKKNGKEVFNGEVREVKENFDFSKHIYAVGELAFLFDSIQPQARYQNKTPLEVFYSMIEHHNAQVDDKKKFEPGMVTVKDSNDSIYRFTNYEDTLTAIREKLCDKLNGYLRIRKQDGKRYLDLVKIEDYGHICNQPIIFGSNLLDYSRNFNSQDIATSVIPLGAHLDTEEVQGLDSYLTIKSVNDGKDYINQSDDLINELGMIRVVKHWDDVTLPENLKRKAEEWLQQAQYESMTIELNAVDMSNFGWNVETFELGDMVEIQAAPLGIKKLVLPIQRRTVYLNELDRNYIVLGNTMQLSYTEQASKAASTIEDKIPQQASILDMALKNASAMINANGEKGNVSIRLKDGQPYEILVMDADTLENSTRAWRWNLSGFGHGTKNAGESEFTWAANVALTMDGEVVATKGTIAGFTMHTGAHWIDDKEWDYLESPGGRVKIGARVDGTAGEIQINGYTVPTYKSLEGYTLKSELNAVDAKINTLQNYITSTEFANYIKTLIWTYLQVVFTGPGGASLESTSRGDLILKGYNIT